MPRLRIGDMLIRAGLIDEMQLQSALAHQRQWGGKLGDVLVELGFLDEMMLWRGLSRQLAIPLVSLADAKPSKEALQALPYALANRRDVFPVALDGQRLTIATGDPTDIGAIDELGFKIGKSTKPVLAPPREIRWAIDRHYKRSPDPLPPPRTRRTIAPPEQVEAEAFTIIRRGGEPLRSVAGPLTTPLSELASAATAAAAPPPKPGPVVAIDGGSGLAAVENDLGQVTRLLRLVVEGCIRRGVFTRDEYLERIKRGGG